MRWRTSTFPINPQIYHDAGPATMVEFPAYEKRLPEIRGTAGNLRLSSQVRGGDGNAGFHPRRTSAAVV